MKRRLVIAALALTIPALLTACEPGETGAAALVGKSRLPESKVASDTDATIAAIGPVGAGGTDPATIIDATVERFVHHELLKRAAAEAGVSVGKGEVDALIASNLSPTTGRTGLEQQAAQQASVPPAELDGYAYDVLLEGKLGVKLVPKGTTEQQQSAVLALYAKVAKQVGVTVSPRYGTYDVSTLRLVSAHNDLSRPLVSEPVPSAAQ